MFLGVVLALPVARYAVLPVLRWRVGPASTRAEHPRELVGEIGHRPPVIRSLDHVVDRERPHVLDDPAADLEALPAHPVAGRRGEVADHLGDVHRVGRIEVDVVALRVAARAPPDVGECVSRRTA